MNESVLDAVPLPDGDANLEPPSPPEVERQARGVLATVLVSGAVPSAVQQTVLEATFSSMTGHRPNLDEPTSAADFVESMRHRDLAYRTRLLQQCLLAALLIDPVDPVVVAQIRAVSAALGVDDGMITTITQLADGQFELAAADFDRNGYTADWTTTDADVLHSSRPIDVPWQDNPDDAALATRWKALEDLDEGSLGLAVSRFYRARGFSYPGTPGSVSPLLAQHDWVHVIADYGATIENELEVFAFIARANDDPRGFSFLAMVVSLFETGVLASGAGLFQPDAGHLRGHEMPERLGDAMLRGARCAGSVDFLGLDWFEIADQQTSDLRTHFGIGDKKPGLGSPGPFESGGITPFQVTSGKAMAASAGVRYEAWGAL